MISASNTRMRRPAVVKSAILFALIASLVVLITQCCQPASADKVTRLGPGDEFDDIRAVSAPASTTTVALIKHKTHRRDLGLLAIKALLLGPLIGLTIKAALIRGIIWAVLAYGLHLFFPALLSTLGLGTGLVGFARQLRPDYSRIAATYLLNLLQTLPGQYNHIIAPIVESIRAIPEGACRYRAVCETASHLIRNVRSMSSTLQRISATVYMNFGTEYSKAWLDGIVQSDCAVKYQQCTTSPISMVAAKLAQTLK